MLQVCKHLHRTLEGDIFWRTLCRLQYPVWTESVPAAAAALAAAAEGTASAHWRELYLRHRQLPDMGTIH